MTTENINLTENQREVLRAFLKLDLKSTSDVAKVVGVSRSTLTFALDGKRSLSDNTVNNLLAHFGLTEWNANPYVAHYLRVGSDIEPLKILVDVIFESAQMFYIKPFGAVDLDEPFTGFFLFQYDSYETGNGLLLVHRDKMRSGKGVVSARPELAKAITPGAFKNVVWADPAEIVLPDEVVRKLEAPFYRQADLLPLNQLRDLLNVNAEVNWLDIRVAAEKSGMSAVDVLNLIQAQGQ